MRGGLSVVSVRCVNKNKDRENGHSMKSGLALKSHKGSQIMTEHVVLSRRQTCFFLQLVVISPFLLFPSVDVSVLLQLSIFFPVGYPDKKNIFTYGKLFVYLNDKQVSLKAWFTLWSF